MILLLHQNNNISISFWPDIRFTLRLKEISCELCV